MKKMKRLLTERLSLFVFTMLFSLTAMAQNVKVSGVVTDESGEPIIGCTIMQKGTSNGATSDLDGKFTLSVPQNSTLTFSYIGFTTQEVKATEKPLVITLHEKNLKINEVVVIGYGTMRKSDLTGSVGSLNAKDMDVPVTNIGQAIQGKIAGLQIVDAGKPGDNVSIKIRGLGSINNCDPLVVIDGVPTDLSLNSLNMADVERLDVLKDASATAIYGSRGANGVVMITTKKGKEGKGMLSFSANFSAQKTTKVPDMLNASQYAALSNDMLGNARYATNPDWADPSLLGTGTNWLDELLHTGYMQNYSLSYSGGSEKAHYYVSGGYLKQTGTVRSVEYNRFTFQENADAQVLPWLKMSNNITVSADKKQQGSYDIGSAFRALPTYAVKDENGNWTGPEGNSTWFGSTRNPIGPTETDLQKTNGYNFLGNITAELSFCKWLKFRSTLGVDAKFWYADNFTPAYNWKPTPVEESSRYKSDNKSFTYLWDNYFLLDYTFAKKHHFNVMAGVSSQWNDFDYLNAQ